MEFGRMLWYVLLQFHGILKDLIRVQPFTHGFPRADIHTLLSLDLLYQLIKETFKDHLVT